MSPEDQVPAPRRRGPLRPPDLVTARSRGGRRRSAFVFRLVDVGALVAVTLGWLMLALPGDLLDSTVRGTAPYLVGISLLIWSLTPIRLYDLRPTERLANHLTRTLIAATVGLCGALVVRLMVGDAAPAIRVVGWCAACLLTLAGCHSLWWALVRRWRSVGTLTPNIVIVGATGKAEDLIRDALRSRDVHILGIFDDRGSRSPQAVLGVPVLGSTSDLLSHRIIPFVDLVVVAIGPAAIPRVRQITASLDILPNPITMIFDRADAPARAAALARLVDPPLAPLRPANDERRAFAKRVQDLVLGVPLLIVLCPVLALIAAAVRIDSAGPVFFKQRRHGFNNEEVIVWKFRTMRHEVADQRAERQVTADDDRVTRVGRLLRKTSLDELPQLINVIRGEMSLVGPRPHAVGMRTGNVESASLVAEYAHRHRIKPGMTGWAAIKGSRGPMDAVPDVSRRVELDIEYIGRQSFWLDLGIMAATLPVVLGDRSAVR